VLHPCILCLGQVCGQVTFQLDYSQLNVYPVVMIRDSEQLPYRGSYSLTSHRRRSKSTSGELIRTCSGRSDTDTGYFPILQCFAVSVFPLTPCLSPTFWFWQMTASLRIIKISLKTKWALRLFERCGEVKRSVSEIELLSFSS